MPSQKTCTCKLHPCGKQGDIPRHSQSSLTPAQWPGYNVSTSCVCKPRIWPGVTFVSHSHHMLISHLSRQEVDGMVVYKSTRLPNGLPQYESDPWIFLRTPGDISRRSCGDQKRLFFTGSQTITICDRSEQNRYFKPKS